MSDAGWLPVRGQVGRRDGEMRGGVQPSSWRIRSAGDVHADGCGRRTTGNSVLRAASIRALRTLDMCPLLPVAVFARLTGAAHTSVGYQQLRRLDSAGLATMRRMDLGHLIGSR